MKQSFFLMMVHVMSEFRFNITVAQVFVTLQGTSIAPKDGGFQ